MNPLKVERTVATIFAAVFAVCMVASIGATFLASWWYAPQSAVFAVLAILGITHAEKLDDFIEEQANG